MFSNLMLVPTYSCPAKCSYCFSHPGNVSLMKEETLKETLHWFKSLVDIKKQEKIYIIFHGGEPLVGGADYFSMALPIIKKELSFLKPRISLQSNLWLLNKELCELFLEYNVSLGTSLDGPEEINDRQRGEGYFKKTMKGIDLARSRGLNVGAICTFTKYSAPYYSEIFDFFLSKELDFTVHESVPVLYGGSKYALSPENYGDLLANLLDLYLENMDKVRISTLDFLIRSVSTKRGGICTFGNCIGDYLAIGPDGAIYPCQRFAGLSSFCLGNIKDFMTGEELINKPLWKKFSCREKHVKEECRDCSYIEFCNGGCPYNALASSEANINRPDPYCSSYKKIFSLITEKALDEFFSEENMEEIITQPPGETILRKGKILSLMKKEIHPKELKFRAKAVLYAAALGMNKTVDFTSEALVKAGVTLNRGHAKGGLLKLSRWLKPEKGLNNLYIHTTFKCNLSCSHCYAEGDCKESPYIDADRIISLCKEGNKLDFRQAIITGGEPLLHPAWKELTEKFREIKEALKPLLIVLRTNLSLPMEPEDIRNLWNSFDKIAISVDGDRESHDLRRGAGSYDRTVKNLHILADEKNCENILLTSILSVEDAKGKAGESVRELAREAGILRVHFKPLLPLGRACYSELETAPEAHWVYEGIDNALSGFTPLTTCGLGDNLYIEPDGNSFPCYAYSEKEKLLGNVLEEGSLITLINSPSFKNLRKHNVDTNIRCKECNLRYLCGGACRAWDGRLRNDFDEPPVNCGKLYERAKSLLVKAMECAGVTQEEWSEAGL